MAWAKRVLIAWVALGLATPVWAASDRARSRHVYEHALQLYLNGDFKRSLAEVNDAVADPSLQAEAYALRARLWHVYGDARQMGHDAAKSLAGLKGSFSKLSEGELVAEGNALLLMGESELALASFDAALNLSKNSPEALAGRARAWRAEGMPDKASDDLSRLLRIKPATTLYLFNRAEAYYDLGRYDEALADLTSALRQNLNFYPAFGLLGATLAQKKDLKRSLAAYNKALEANPEYAFAYLGRAALRLAQGVEEAAFADFDEAIRVDGHDYAPYFNRAEAFWRRGNRQEALADYRKAVDAERLEADFAVKIGDRLAELQLWNEAVDAYTRGYVLGGGEPNRRRSLPKGLAPERRPGAQPGLAAAAFTALLRRAQAYEVLKDQKRALQDATEAVERGPSSGPAWAARGTLALRMGREKQAIADLNKAVKLEPKNAEVRVARGSYYSRTGRPKLALEDFNAAIAADPKRSEAFNDRGALYANTFKDPDKALEDILTAVALSPGDPGYQFNLAMLRLKQKQYLKAVEAFNAALDLKGPPPRILEHRAEAYFQLGDHANALQDIQVALEKDPKYSPLYDTLGNIRLRSYEYEQAVRDFDQALQLDDKNVSALVHRGIAYGAMGSLKAALKDFRRAAELDPDSKEALAYLCQAKRLLNDASGAVHDCGRAMALDADYAPAYLQRGLSRLALNEAPKAVEDIAAAEQLGLRRAEGLLASAVAHISQKQYKPAHMDFERAVGLDPGVHSPDFGFGAARGGDIEDFFNAVGELDSVMSSDSAEPYVYVVRGDALRNAEHFDKAIMEYTKAMELDANNADAYLGRGACLMAQDAFDAAQQDFLHAAELRSQDASIHVRLATLLTVRRQYRPALEEAAKAIRLDPKNSEAYLRAGNVYYFLKNHQRALENYLLAAKLDPLSPAAFNGVGLGYFALRQYPDALENFSRAIALNPGSDRFYRNRASTYTSLKSFSNAAREFKSAGAVNTDPALVEEYKKLIDESQAKSASEKS